jgi:serine/threonine-protein kinase
MGRVDLAVRLEGSFERLFAVKRLKAALADDTGVREMFLDEARIAGLVRHPNVVSVLDVGHDTEGPYLVMEWVEGVSVAQLLAQRSAHPLPVDVCLRVAAQVADGLHAAHEQGDGEGRPLHLVHRDVSPQNILIGFDGVARVTDFGIAKALGRTTQTSTGILKGKLGYISPEQLRFEPADRRADLFGLGVVLFELLTGKRLYRGEDELDGPRRILSEPPPDLGDFRVDVEPELVELMFELLAKSREGRPETAKAVAQRLEAMLAALTAAGETTDTAELLARHFSDAREQQRQRTRESVERARVEVTKSTAGVAASVGPARRSSRLAWGLGAGAVVLLSTLAVTLGGRALARREPSAAPSTVLPVQLAATPAAAAGSGATAPAHVETSGPSAPSVAPAAPSAPAALRAGKGGVRPAPSARSRGAMPMWESY